MKNFKTVCSFIILCCFLIGTANAQEKNQSLLWKIEGNGIKKSYVFGTFHMLPKEDFIIKDKVKKAIEETQLTILELDMDDPSMQSEMMKHAVLPNGKTLANYMDKDEYTLVDSYLKEKMGMGLSQFNTFKPLMVSSMVMMGYLGKDYASYEATLIKLSQDQNKEIKGLETVEYQMSAFDKQPYEQQLDDIVKMLTEKESVATMFTEMIALYKNEDIEGLYDFMDDYFDNDTAKMNALLHDRNANWIPEIGSFSKNTSVFYGVGAGHLGGELGVVNLLKKAGYTVTPVQ